MALRHPSPAVRAVSAPWRSLVVLGLIICGPSSTHAQCTVMSAPAVAVDAATEPVASAGRSGRRLRPTAFTLRLTVRCDRDGPFTLRLLGSGAAGENQVVLRHTSGRSVSLAPRLRSVNGRPYVIGPLRPGELYRGRGAKELVQTMVIDFGPMNEADAMVIGGRYEGIGLFEATQ